MNVGVVGIVFLMGLLALDAGAAEPQGSFATPRVSDVVVRQDQGLTVRRAVFSYADGAEHVVGTKTSVQFTLRRPVKDVWPIFQDFNLWQNPAGFRYSGVFGDREGKLEYLIDPDAAASVHSTQAFVVQQVIPGSAIVLHSPPWQRAEAGGGPAASHHEGKHVFVLTEVDGATTISAAMEHTYRYHGPNAARDAAAALALQTQASNERKQRGTRDVWETAFVPKLRQLVEVAD